MSDTMTEAVKRWTAKRKSALVVEIIQDLPAQGFSEALIVTVNLEATGIDPERLFADPHQPVLQAGGSSPAISPSGVTNGSASAKQEPLGGHDRTLSS